MKITFLGGGNMANALIGGLVTKGFAATDIAVVELNADNRSKLEAAYGVRTYAGPDAAAWACDVIVLAVKPQSMKEAIAPIGPHLKDQLVVSIAAGLNLASLSRWLGGHRRLVRTMPNTPAMVGEGMTAACKNAAVTEQEMETVLALLSSFGKAKLIPEALMDAVVAVSGSSPAYVYLFIEAMADAAVLQGMPRPLAYEFAAQSVYGAAKMVLETGKHPGELKDMVCSPKGTTIEAVRVLEEKGFRSSVIEAMIACGDKAKKM